MIAQSTVRSADLAVVAFYVLAMIALGLYFMRRNQTTEEYFLGNRAFPGWAIGLSMLGTSISSITFLALPAAAYALDWRLFVPNLALPIVVVIAVIHLIPLYRNRERTSVFEYLEERFGPAIRLYGAISFIVLQFFRVAMVLYLVSIPLSFLTNLSVASIIVWSGLFVAVYTVAGGIEAVIWTDVVQSLVLLVGGPICLLLMAMDVPGGLSELIRSAAAADKFSLGEMHFDLARRTLPYMLLIGLYRWLGEYMYNQNVVQRYIAARSTREASKASIICVVMSIPTWAFFFLIGSCLFVYYQILPDATAATLQADEVFPYFILSRVPVGVAGLVIAAVVAAAMSSLDSSLNASATVFTVDILKRHLLPGRHDRTYLLLARVACAVMAVFMIAGALFFSRIPKESMLHIDFIAVSIFAGCLFGVFLLGLYTTRVGNRAALISVALALLFNLYLVLCHFDLLPEAVALDVHEYLIGILVNVVFIVLAGLLSLVLKEQRNLAGLTVWKKRSPEPSVSS